MGTCSIISGSATAWSEMVVLPVLLEPDETGGYVVTSTLLPGLVTEGDTRQEALLHAMEAAEGLLEVMLEDGDEVPAELLGYQPGDLVVLMQ